MKWLKICIYCKEEKLLSEFYNDKYKPDGKKPRCKICEKEYIDIEKRRIYEKIYWDSRRIERRIMILKSINKNKKKHHETRKKRYDTLKFKIKQKSYRTYRKSIEYPVLWTFEEMEKLIKNSEYCYYCNKELKGKYEIEHKTPLSKGGKNSIDNIVISCIHCNRSKGIKTEKEFNIFREVMPYQMV